MSTDIVIHTGMLSQSDNLRKKRPKPKRAERIITEYPDAAVLHQHSGTIIL